MATKLPRGIRNNNPLNIMLSDRNDWRGKIYANTDGTFEQFKHIVYGLRAAIILIINIIKYLKKNGSKPASISNIIERYAREDTYINIQYATFVAKGMGRDASDEISFDDKDSVCALVYEMAKFENGKAIDMLDVRQAYNMAIGGSAYENSLAECTEAMELLCPEYEGYA